MRVGGGPGTYFAPHGLAHYNFLVGGIRDCYRKKYVKKSFVRNCFDDVEHGDKVFEMVCFHDESPVVSLPNQSIISYYHYTIIYEYSEVLL